MIDIIEYHKGRKSVDHDFLRKQWELEDRERLEEMIKANPRKKHRVYGFGVNASMGYVPNA